MAAIVSSPSVLGRISPYVNLSGLSLQINGNGATYVQGAGNGLPFDLAAFLSASLVNDMPYLNPGDVLAIFIPSISSTGDYLTGLLTLGTPTYAARS